VGVLQLDDITSDWGYNKDYNININIIVGRYVNLYEKKGDNIIYDR